MSDYSDLAKEIKSLPPNTAFRLTPSAQHIIVQALLLVGDVSNMIDQLDHHGMVSKNESCVRTVMLRMQEVA